jgi:hypothetical protein
MPISLPSVKDYSENPNSLAKNKKTPAIIKIADVIFIKIAGVG